MGNSILEQAVRLLREKKKYRYWLTAFLCLAVLVAFSTVAILKMNGQAMSHKEKVLDCQLEVHQHTDKCYDEDGKLICGYADYVVHTHNEDCYDKDGELVCRLPEIKAHTHDQGCYQEEKELACTLEEAEGHIHTDECYSRERGALICGQEESIPAVPEGAVVDESHPEGSQTAESGTETADIGESDTDNEANAGTYTDENGVVYEGHIHTDECYEWTENLICTQEEKEGHTHTDGCYETKQKLVCGELELHTHDENCYDGEGRLTCGLLELKEHVHGEECFKTVEMTAEEVVSLNTAKTEEKKEEEKAAETTKTFEDDDMKVTVEYGEFANIPDEAELIVKQITQESDPEHFAERDQEFKEEVGDMETSMDSLMDIGFYVDGEEIEPDDAVTVKIQFKDKKDIAAGKTLNMVHFANDGTEVLESSNVDEDGVITFKMDSFSEVALFAAGELGVGIQKESKNNDDEYVRFYCIKETEKKAELKSTMKSEECYQYFFAYNGNYYLLPADYDAMQGGRLLQEVFGSDGFVLSSEMEKASIGYSIDNGEHITINTWDGAFGWKLSPTDEKITDIYYFPGNMTVYDNALLDSILGEGESGSDSSFKVVFNPRNGNGVEAHWAYSGNPATLSADDGRVTVEIPEAAVTDGEAKIKLPSNTDLNEEFDVGVGYESSQTIRKPGVDYQYKLVGWYNIANKRYYNVSNGPVSATVKSDQKNVFYADWVAVSYDFASKNENGAEGEDTSKFVTTKVFDYNSLFNAYSTEIECTEGADGNITERWYDTEQFLELAEPIRSFLFISGANKRGIIGQPDHEQDWNRNHQEGDNGIPTQNKWGDENGNGNIRKELLSYLFNEDQRDDKGNHIVGVHYLGTGNYLYSLEKTIQEQAGYYVYDSTQTAAAYNQSGKRFYLNKKPDTFANTTGGFFPLNGWLTGGEEKSGKCNYHFGMSSEINFYLPADADGAEQGKNQYQGKDMEFEFSGDDDVWVYIDDKLVLDMGGIHAIVSGSINFTTGKAIVRQGKTGPVVSEKNISTEQGEHKLTVYYLERGAGASNCKIKFNIVPAYMLEPTEAKTVTVSKNWIGLDKETEKQPIEVGLYQDGHKYGENIILSDDNDWKYTWEGLPVSGNDIADHIYELQEATKLGDFIQDSYFGTKSRYQCWTETGTLVDGEKIILLNLAGDKALSYSGSGFIAKDVQSSAKVLHSDSVSDEDGIQWLLEKNGPDGFYLKNTTHEKYLKIDNGELETVERSDASTFKLLNNAVGAGLGTNKYRIIFSNGSFSVQLINGNDVDGNGEMISKELRVYPYMKQEITSEVKDYTITNTSKKIHITKVDSADKTKKLDGSKFRLEKEDKELETFSIPSSGYSLSNLGDGSYTLTETEAPSGYSKPENPSIAFEIANGRIKDGSLQTSGMGVECGDDGLSLMIENEKSSSPTPTPTPSDEAKIRLIKVTAEDEPKPLENAKFNLYKKTENGEGTEIFRSDLTSDSEGIISLGNDQTKFYELPTGTYYLEETNPPKGYNKLSEKVKITIVSVNDVIKVSFIDPRSGKETEVTAETENGEQIYKINIPNSSSYALPQTGGLGTDLFTIGGALLLMTTAFLLYGHSVRQRRNR